MPRPLFSIILPTYNRGPFLAKAIESIQQQTVEEWELIVVDDGSTDNTREIVQTFSDKDKKIKYIYQENAERSAARNNGITNAKGTYICFLDSDDYCLNNYLSNFKNFILTNESPVALLLCNSYLDVNAQLEKLPTPSFKEYTPAEFFLINSIATPRVCLHKDISKQYLFDPTLSISEDTDLWVRIARHFPFHYLEAYTYALVQHGGRSVHRLNTNSAIKNLKTKKLILSRLSKEEVADNIRRDILHSAWFHLAQSYFENRHFFGLLKATFRASAYQPLTRWKEKLFMIYVVLKTKLRVSS